MKMKGGIFLVIWVMGAVVAQAQEIIVSSDKKLNEDFSKYKTYYWASQVDRALDDGHYFLNDLVFKADVRSAVHGELEGRGYRIDRTHPDLIVNFRVFDKPVRIKGYKGFGSDYWGAQEYRNVEDTTSYNLEAGTLIISLVDRETGDLVWHGFASGLIDNQEFVKDEGKIREAVNLIFEEFGFRASEYTKRNKR